MHDFVLASGNAHKAEEFFHLFEGKVGIISAPSTLAVEEVGETYQENALIKAKSYYDVIKKPTLADDSGLTVVELPGILGVQSARFLPDQPNYQDKCLEIIRLLQGHTSREAFFTCVLCFYLSPSEIYFFEGRVHGVIGSQPKGAHGFGYDPIFIPHRPENDGQTLAELPDWKNKHSHRAKAVGSALSFFVPRPR